MKRFEWIDIVRGLCILAIVACHTVKESFTIVPGVQEFLTCFMINTFFVLSGYLSKPERKSMKEMLCGKWKSIILPYFAYSVLFIVIDIVQYLVRYKALKDIMSDCYKTFVLSGIGTLWFLPVILGVQILYQRFLLGNLKIKSIYFAGLFISFVYVFWHQKLSNDLLLVMIVNAPLITVAKIFISSVFFVAGVYLRKIFTPNIKKPNIFISLGGVLFAFFLGSNISGYDFNQLILPNPILYLFVSLICSISIIYLGASLYYSIGWRCRFVQWFGRNSLTVMCTHYTLLIPLVRTIVDRVCGSMGVSLQMPYDLLVVLIIVLLEIPIVLLVNKAKEYSLKQR